MLVLAIDPGDRKSAWVLYDTETREIRGHDIQENEIVAGRLSSGDFIGRAYQPEFLVVEMIASYGMPVGKTVFETCVWIGRFVQAWPLDHRLVYRSEVKMYLCHSMRAKDGHIRQALLDRFGPKGTKKTPGAVYGLRGDEWAALAVAVTAAETMTMLETVGEA